ncbi:MAG: helix-turn-helix transcriptional regulator [Clostridia bacterium]|nr:helix-turn-helix transcriptional regulator [Clostridia bacterium]
MIREDLKEFKVLAKTLTELRLANGYTQLDVAAKLRVTYQSYQAYERGIAVPTLQNFIKLADFYDVSLDYLIGRKDI